MKFDKSQSIEILERTPVVLKTLLNSLPDEWIMSNEGPETFSPFDVIGHLIHGERTDWTTRAKIILEFGLSKPFTPWDRFAQYEVSKGKTLAQLLDEFEEVRNENLQWLKSVNISENDLEKKGMHPVLGEVTPTKLTHYLGGT